MLGTHRIRFMLLSLSMLMFGSLLAQQVGLSIMQPKELGDDHLLFGLPALNSWVLVDTTGRYLFVGALDELTFTEAIAPALEVDPIRGIRERNLGQIEYAGPGGTPVWTFLSSWRDELGAPLPIEFLGKLSREKTATLLPKGFPPPFTRTEIRQARRAIDTTGQYKKLNRETVAEIEAGYWDEAHQYLDTFLTAFPGDWEGLFAKTLLETRRRNLPLALVYAEKALKGGIPLSRFQANLHGFFTPLLTSPEFQSLSEGFQGNALLHGPMLAQLTDTAVSVWVRTEGVHQVHIRLYDSVGAYLKHFPPTKTNSEREYTTILPISGLKENTPYGYEVWIDGEKASQAAKFRTLVSKGKPSRVLLGFSGGAGYTPRFERMWDTLCTHGLSAFFLLGDNVYIDHPERPATQKYCYYRRQSRPEYRRFTSEAAIYAIWDDHDFTYNDERGGPEIDAPYWKRDVWEVFKNQWANPYYGGGEAHPGCYMDFSIGDIDFFFLDCRYYRQDPRLQGASMLGSIQKQWLKEKLKASSASFKVIASSVPWAYNTKPGSLDTWDGHPEEREEIFSFIEAQRIEGVLLISADRHRSDAWKIERPKGYDFYDLMSSKLTNVHTHRVMPGSLFGYNKMCSFGILEFDTSREDPQVQYRVYNIENEEIHRLTLYKSQFTFE